MANWRDKLFEMDQRIDSNINDLDTERTETKEKDVGLINPTSGSGVLARQNGKVEAYADYGLGFQLDPQTQSLLVIAPKIKMLTNSVEKLDLNSKTNFIQNEYKDALDLINGGDK